VKSWIKPEAPRQIPWTAVNKPLCGCAVSRVSSAGLALRSGPPFDQQIERENPWKGDPSYRIIPRTARTADLKMYHLHVDPVSVYLIDKPTEVDQYNCQEKTNHESSTDRQRSGDRVSGYPG